MSELGGLILKKQDSGQTSANKLNDFDGDINGDYQGKNKDGGDLSPMSLGRSRNDTHTIQNKSNMKSQEPSTPASEEISEDGIDMLPTLRSEMYQTNNGETDRSPLNYGNLAYQQQQNRFQQALVDQLREPINNVEQAKRSKLLAKSIRDKANSLKIFNNLEDGGTETRELSHSDQLMNLMPSNSFLDFLAKNQDFNKVSIKSLSYDEHKFMKIRALYGRRVTPKLNYDPKNLESEDESDAPSNLKSIVVPAEDTENDEQNVNDMQQEQSCLQYMLIHPDQGWKQLFDVWILFLVAYSCSSNILFIAYSIDNSSLTHTIIYWFVEIFFYIDFVLTWFSGYRNEDQKLVMLFKPIAVNYLKTWFIIDFVAIFPFQLVLSGSNSKATKLFRIPRLLKIQKLLDVQENKKILRRIYFKGKLTTIDSIISLYNTMFVYQLFRILIMLIIFTYFLGTFWYLLSIEQTMPEDGETWYTTFIEGNYDQPSDQLIVSLYYSLTMLSTVGYGDLFPISNLEMIVGVICMWMGVASFSVIMDQFSQCQEDFDFQMGDPDRKEFFDEWLLLLQRFVPKGAPSIPSSLINHMESDFNFFQLTDRNQYFNDHTQEFVKNIPEKIKAEVTVRYLWVDLLYKFRRFFDCAICNRQDDGRTYDYDNNLVFLITQGLIPRRFLATQEDCIIYDEFDMVDEMYFILDGQIGIGYRRQEYPIWDRPFKVCKGQAGTQIICDFYAIHHKKSNFIYEAQEDSKGYALKKSYLHYQIFENYPDFREKMQKNSDDFYLNWIFKPIIADRQAELKKLNRAREQFFQFEMINKQDPKNVIPSMQDYRNCVRDEFKVKPAPNLKPTRKMRSEMHRINVQYGKPKTRQLEILNDILENANRKGTKDHIKNVMWKLTYRDQLEIEDQEKKKQTEEMPPGVDVIFYKLEDVNDNTVGLCDKAIYFMQQNNNKFIELQNNLQTAAKWIQEQREKKQNQGSMSSLIDKLPDNNIIADSLSKIPGKQKKAYKKLMGQMREDMSSHK